MSNHLLRAYRFYLGVTRLTVLSFDLLRVKTWEVICEDT